MSIYDTAMLYSNYSISPYEYTASKNTPYIEEQRPPTNSIPYWHIPLNLHGTEQYNIINTSMIPNAFNSALESYR